MHQVDWYFDFISPFAAIGFHRLRELPAGAEIRYVPVLFAGLLEHWKNTGPAEIEPKRRWTYRSCHWTAKSFGIPFRFPAKHPFNPLHHLRLAIACGVTRESVGAIFEALWTDGGAPDDPLRFRSLCERLGVTQEAIGADGVKAALRGNTEKAAAAGVFGVPSFVVNGDVFWGADATPLVAKALRDSGFLADPELTRLDRLPVGVERKR